MRSCERPMRHSVRPTRFNWRARGRHAFDLFITNDDRLSQKVVPGVQFVISLERAFL
jgi:hypothetical protein